jgi:hypothetical protein
VAGTFDLAMGGTINGHGIFDIASTTLNVQGGSVFAGVLSNPYHLGALPTTVEFEFPIPASSTGTIDVEIATKLQGTIPKHWTLDVTGGPVTASSSGNNGTLGWEANVQLIFRSDAPACPRCRKLARRFSVETCSERPAGG